MLSHDGIFVYFEHDNEFECVKIISLDNILLVQAWLITESIPLSYYKESVW